MFPDDHPVVVDDMNKRLEKTASIDLPQIVLTSRFHGQTVQFFSLIPCDFIVSGVIDSLVATLHIPCN